MSGHFEMGRVTPLQIFANAEEQSYNHIIMQLFHHYDCCAGVTLRVSSYPRSFLKPSLGMTMAWTEIIPRYFNAEAAISRARYTDD